MTPPEAPLLTADLGPGVIAGFTGRAGGCSAGNWAGFDLALHVGDDPAHVAENRRRLGAWAGAPVIFGRQVHGVRCATVPSDGESADPLRMDLNAGPGAGHDDAHGHAQGGFDALVTARRGTALGVLVADCVPVLLADPGAGVVATAHAGRPGLLAGVLAGVLDGMRRAGARPGLTRVALGPSAGPCCYEVPQAMADAASALIPATRARTTRGTPSLDLRAGCRAVLEAAGVGEVTLVGGCTIEDTRFYSYRRSPVTGRFAGVVRMVA